MNLAVGPDIRSPEVDLGRGDFWHSCAIDASCPMTRREFWLEKSAANKYRDWRVDWERRRFGGRVLRIWEHEMRKRGVSCARRIQAALVNSLARRPRWVGRIPKSFLRLLLIAVYAFYAFFAFS